ncbi:unnamed protein product [Ectocarpus sp. 12 AP-2014]
MTSPPDGSGGDGSTAFPSAELWTLREGVQGTAPCTAPSTPPCFDRNAEEQQQQQQQQHAHTHRRRHLLSARGRAGSFDNARSTEGDDGDNQSWLWSLSSSYGAMMAARTRSSSTGNFVGFSSAPGDCERFPPLFRRRTFTEPSRTKSRCLDDGEEEELTSASASAAAAAGRNRSGKVPTSMSEDNMLNLLSNHRDRIPPASTTTFPGRSPSVRPHHCLSEAETASTELHAHVLEANSGSMGGGGVTTSARVGTSSSTSSTSSDESICNGGVDSEGAVGGTAGTTTTATTMTPMQLEEMEEHPPPPSPLPSADSRARGGNASMLRLHRAGLMEDTSRCVMDIVEGRAAAAPNAGSSQAAHYGAAVAPTAAVALEEVKEHLRSLPERYALTVSPEDVLDHMALFAAVSAAAAETATQKHASSSSSSASAQDESLGAEPPTVRVVARPSLLALSSSHPAAAGDGEGGTSCGSGLAGVGRAYSLTVACRQSPLLLGAIASSLRSAGASCLDVDVVSTTRTAATRSCGLTLARLEVRVIGGQGLTAVSSAAAAAAAAVGAGGTAALSSASASGWRQRSSVQRGEMEEEEDEEEGEISRRLEVLLSSTIAAALLLAGDKREGRSGQEEEDDDDDDGAGEREGEADIELLELAGKGRFSRTYRARWRGSTVAVKTLELSPEVDREHEAAGAEIVGDGGGSRAVVVAEFERELHIVSNLRHPNVCGFRGVSVSLPHHLSLVYDFLDNGTLGDRLWDTGSSGGGSSGSSSAVHGCGVGGVGGEREWGSRRGRGSEPLRSTDLLRIVTDVVNGMLYLHEVGASFGASFET